MPTQEQDRQTQTGKAAPSRGRRARKGAGRRPNGRSGARTRSRSVAELEQVIESLEARIADLTSPNTIRSTVAGASNQVGRAAAQASNHVGDLVADSLTELADRMRGGATSLTSAARAGTGALQRIGVEMERRPLMTVAIALGVGFLAAMVGRREAA
jgi:hypothetical protein